MFRSMISCKKYIFTRVLEETKWWLILRWQSKCCEVSAERIAIAVKESRKEETLKILTWKDIYKDLPFFCIYILCKLRISLNFQWNLHVMNAVFAWLGSTIYLFLWYVIYVNFLIKLRHCCITLQLLLRKISQFSGLPSDVEPAWKCPNLKPFYWRVLLRARNTAKKKIWDLEGLLMALISGQSPH